MGTCNSRGENLAVIGTKKSMIFTLMSILLVSVLIAAVTLTTSTTYKQKSYVTASRISTMNDFIYSVEQDFSRSTLIAGYRSILSMQKFIVDNETFISDIQGIFKELFLNGTIDGVEQELMANSSILLWSERINQIADNLNVNIILKPIDTYIYHNSPWSVVIVINISFNVSDKNDLASWHFNESFNQTFKIINFEDPLYTYYSNDKVTNIITKASNMNFVNETDNNDTTVLNNHLFESYYINSTDGPSFLMRFAGNLTPSVYGIESLVNIEDFSVQGLVVHNKSVVDFHYFDENYDISNDYCTVKDMPSWFRINSSKKNTYEIDDLGVNC